MKSVEHPLNLAVNRVEIVTQCYRDTHVLLGVVGRRRISHRAVVLIPALLLNENVNNQHYCYVQFLAVSLV